MDAKDLEKSNQQFAEQFLGAGGELSDLAFLIRTRSALRQVVELTKKLRRDLAPEPVSSSGIRCQVSDDGE